MTGRINRILEQFKQIQKARSKITTVGRISIYTFFTSDIITIITTIIDKDLSTVLAQRVTTWGMLIALIALFMMIGIADHEQAPIFEIDDLKRIDIILNNEKISTPEARLIFKEVVKNSIKPKVEKFVGISVVTGLLLSPVYFYIIDAILKNGWIVKVQNGMLVFGTGMSTYIRIVMCAYLVVGAANVMRIRTNRDNKIKGHMLTVIDEIELWKSIK